MTDAASPDSGPEPGQPPDADSVPANGLAAESDPFQAIHPRPGKAMNWPPTPDQRGLSSPYPPGGVDPHPDQGRREERLYLQLLVGMVLAIVLGGFAIGVVAVLLGFTGTDVGP